MKQLGRNLYENSITRSVINSAVSFQYFDQLEKDHQKILKLNKEENILKNLIKKKLINEEKKIVGF